MQSKPKAVPALAAPDLHMSIQCHWRTVIERPHGGTYGTAQSEKSPHLLLFICVQTNKTSIWKRHTR